MAKKLTVNEIFYFLYGVLFFLGFFVDIRWIPHYSYFRNLVIVLNFLIALIHFKKIFETKLNFMWWSVFSLCILVFLSIFINYDFAISRFNKAFIFCASLVSAWLVFNVLDNYSKPLFLNGFFACLIAIILIEDSLILLEDLNFIKSISNGEIYLTGNKFNVAFLHITGLSFLLRDNVKKRMKKGLYNLVILSFSLLSLFITLNINTKTGFLLVIICLLLYLIMRNRKKIHYTALLVFLFSYSFLFVFLNQLILNIPFVQYIITNLLNRDVTLTARTLIYDLVPSLLKNKFLFGYGFDTSYNYLFSKYLLPNTQNGILEWIWNSGIFSVLIIIIMTLLCFKRKNNVKPELAFFVLVCVYIVGASIEITFGINFFIILHISYYYPQNKIIYTKESCVVKKNIYRNKFAREKIYTRSL